MKLFRIPIKIEISFFVVAVFLGLSRARDMALLVEWILVVFASILLHEFGHAFAARAFGLSPEIRLYQMGGLTYLKLVFEQLPEKQIGLMLYKTLVAMQDWAAALDCVFIQLWLMLRLSVFEPPKRIVFSDWEYYSSKGPLPFEARLTSDFTVIPVSANKTVLRVVQDGFPTDFVADEFYAGCERGWHETFAGIRRYLETASVA